MSGIGVLQPTRVPGGLKYLAAKDVAHRALATYMAIKLLFFGSELRGKLQAIIAPGSAKMSRAVGFAQIHLHVVFRNTSIRNTPHLEYSGCK